MTGYPRLRMRRALVERELPERWRPRTFRAGDAAALGRLMLAAYRGSVDDEGETESDAIAEVERTLDGAYGPFLPECSFAVEEDGSIVGASFVSVFESRPCLTYLVVHPDLKRRGIGAFLVAVTGNALLAVGHRELDLFVTESNEPAVSLYRKLGFEVVDRITSDA